MPAKLALARFAHVTFCMAAVFALVFLFVLASVALLLKVFLGGSSLVGIFAMVTFVLLASGVFVGLFKMSKRWEHEADVKH